MSLILTRRINDWLQEEYLAIFVTIKESVENSFDFKTIVLLFDENKETMNKTKRNLARNRKNLLARNLIIFVVLGISSIMFNKKP